MAGKIFLKLTGATGESQKDKFESETEIDSVSWSGSNPASFKTGTGGSVSDVQLNDVQITKLSDKSSGILFKYGCNAKHITTATLSFTKAAETNETYLLLTMSEVVVTSFSIDEEKDSHTRGRERFNLAYSKIIGKYYPQKNDGSLDAAVPFGYYVSENKYMDT
jgi:type VI secretion system secreted protein Hcp